MRIILMFDLPNIETKEKKEYLKFHKEIIRNGYFMMQYSVYCKAIHFKTKIDSEIIKIKKHLPSDGNVRLLVITEKQYDDMKLLLGNKKINERYNNAERYIKI